MIVCPNLSHCHGCEDYSKKTDHSGDPHCPSCALTQHRTRVAKMEEEEQEGKTHWGDGMECCGKLHEATKGASD